MCLSSLFKQPKIDTPSMPAAPTPTPMPAPTPTKVESQANLEDMNQRRKKQLRSGLLSTIKGGVFGSGAELSSGTGKSTLG
jgi:hypothetical protein